MIREADQPNSLTTCPSTAAARAQSAFRDPGAGRDPEPRDPVRHRRRTEASHAGLPSSSAAAWAATATWGRGPSAPTAPRPPEPWTPSAPREGRGAGVDQRRQLGPVVSSSQRREPRPPPAGASPVSKMNGRARLTRWSTRGGAEDRPALRAQRLGQGGGDHHVGGCPARPSSRPPVPPAPGHAEPVGLVDHQQGVVRRAHAGELGSGAGRRDGVDRLGQHHAPALPRAASAAATSAGRRCAGPRTSARDSRAASTSEAWTGRRRRSASRSASAVTAARFAW